MIPAYLFIGVLCVFFLSFFSFLFFFKSVLGIHTYICPIVHPPRRLDKSFLGYNGYCIYALFFTFHIIPDPSPKLFQDEEKEMNDMSLVYCVTRLANKRGSYKRERNVTTTKRVFIESMQPNSIIPS
ncbi:hypothetical protein F4809DRAFT_541133 [Biscogniauxia mediterranea]|nr:hypothetical protein F4809DRAFT_541133 [Biscogniauxia mediterranea]